MYFADLQRNLLEYLRLKLFNGELTERGLARSAGISQPHIHNAVKGLKSLSPELCDRVLETLGLSILDLVARDELARYTRRPSPTACWIRVLDGRLGPGNCWPVRTISAERFDITQAELSAMGYPVAARLGADERMRGAIRPDDWAILDQAQDARRTLATDALYLVNHEAVPLIRRVRLIGSTVYLVTEDALHRPHEWDRLKVPAAGVTSIIRAKVRLVAPHAEWQDGGQPPLRGTTSR